jgi:hypothetical protein
MAGPATEWEIPRCPEWRDGRSMRGTEAFPKDEAPRKLKAVPESGTGGLGRSPIRNFPPAIHSVKTTWKHLESSSSGLAHGGEYVLIIIYRPFATATRAV